MKIISLGLTFFLKIGFWVFAKFSWALRKLSIHRLVAALFLGCSLSSKMQVNHKDKNREHNHVYNLEWVTRMQNVVHRNKSIAGIPTTAYNWYTPKSKIRKPLLPSFAEFCKHLQV